MTTRKAVRPVMVGVRLSRPEYRKLKAEHRELWPSLSWSAFLRQRLGLSEVRVPFTTLDPDAPTRWTSMPAGAVRKLYDGR